LLVHEPKPFFWDRKDAGKRLAEKLIAYSGNNTQILAIPRGGVPVALEVAKKLNATLDVVVVRKIPIPWEPEAGYGAVTDDGTVVLNEPLVQRLQLTQSQIQEDVNKVKAELDRRSAAYRGSKPFPSLKDKTVILVDDGLASGFTMVAAVKSARQHGARKLVVAVPAASIGAFKQLKPLTDDLVCLIISDATWFAVASFYQQWSDLTDDEIIKLLEPWRAEKNDVGEKSEPISD
jgi:putative phosphoribosyl transferase